MDRGTEDYNAISTTTFSTDTRKILLPGSVTLANGYFKKGVEAVLKNFHCGNFAGISKVVVSKLRLSSIPEGAALHFEHHGAWLK